MTDFDPQKLIDSYQPEELDYLKSLIANDGDRLGHVVAMMEGGAIMHALDTTRWSTEQELCDLLDIDRERLQKRLHAALQSDHPWVEADRTEYDDWLWRRTVEGEGHWGLQHPAIISAKSRLEAAAAMLKTLGLSQTGPDVFNIARTVNEYVFEAGMVHTLLHKPRPTWATARGFQECYEACVQRARLVDQGDSGALNVMHTYVGAAMWEARTLLVSGGQATRLAEPGSELESIAYAHDAQLPFRPLFVDFSGDKDSRGALGLPSFTTTVAKEKLAGIVGALVDRHHWNEEGTLLIAPFFFCNAHLDEPIVCHGMAAYNQGGPGNSFRWGDQTHTFSLREQVMSLVTATDATRGHPDVLDEYRMLVRTSAALVMRVLYLLDAFNVRTEPKALERRDRKRAEKRGWSVPLVVRVDRPARRYTRDPLNEGTGSPQTHQYDVAGHYKHVQRGSHVACKVCRGDPLEVGCSACHGTGMDPEKVKPCTRRDERTGALTCPDGCRRERVPDHVRGPDEAPYIPKTRRLAA